MKYDQKKYHRKSTRLKGWDYSQPGAYFVTVCTRNRECLFGEIRNDEMELNGLGEIILERWSRIPRHFKNIELDAFQIMPNHIHGTFFIIEQTVGAKHSERDNPIGLQNINRNASPLRDSELKLTDKEKEKMTEHPIMNISAYEYYFKARQKIISSEGAPAPAENECTVGQLRLKRRVWGIGCELVFLIHKQAYQPVNFTLSRR